jgi:integrase
MSTNLILSQNDVMRMIELADLADSTKVKYRQAVERYLATGNSLADSEALSAYAQTISKSGRAFLKSAIKLWTEHVAMRVKGESTPETAHAVTATLHRLEALNASIKVKASKGKKIHTWLSQTEVSRLLATCDVGTTTGQRDRLVLGILTGAGLRREESVNLKWSDIEYLPLGNKMRTVLQVKGKGAKDRTVPISDRLAAALDAWQEVTGPNGLVIRSLVLQRNVRVFTTRYSGSKFSEPTRYGLKSPTLRCSISITAQCSGLYYQI